MDGLIAGRCARFLAAALVLAFAPACGDDEQDSSSTQSSSDTCYYPGATGAADCCFGDPCCGDPCCYDPCCGAPCDTGAQCSVDEDCGPGFVCQGGVCVMVPTGTLPECASPPALAEASFGAGVQNMPGALATADLAGDGTDDLLIARIDGVVVWESLGGAMFEESGPYPSTVYGRPRGVAVAELGGDTLLDVIVLGEGQPGSLGRLYGDTTQVFVPQPVIQAGANPTRLELGDVDGDGALDVVLMSSDLPELNVVHVLLADGQGDFLVPIDVTPAAPPFDVALEEITGDGTLDLAVAHAMGVTVLEGRGTGGFDELAQLTVATTAVRGGVAVGDLDANGSIELVRAADLGGTGELATWTWNGATTDPVPSHTYALALGLGEVTVTDLDADGLGDLVAAARSADGVMPVSAEIVWMPALADGTLSCQASYPLAKPAEALLVADIDGDGAIDIGTASGVDTVTLLLSSG